MSYLDKLNPNSRFYIGPEDTANTAEKMVVSRAIDVAGGTATDPVEAVSIPLGALVTKVGLLWTENLAGGDVDLGDGDNPDRYIDGLATTATNEFIKAPHPTTGSASTDEIAGRYYAAADTIDVTITASSATTGICKVIAWYTLGDTLGT